MTDKNQQIDAIEKIESNDKLSGKRRALMKGAAAAVPVVLTMRSGAAFAATSMGSCVARDNFNAGNVKPDVLIYPLSPEIGDGWVRRAGFCRRLKPVIGSGSQFDTYNFTENAMSKWQRESNTVLEQTVINKEYTFVRPGIMRDSSTQVEYQIVSARACSFLVHINPLTDVSQPMADFNVGNAESLPGGAGLPYIQGSCWASVNPGGTNPINLNNL